MKTFLTFTTSLALAVSLSLTGCKKKEEAAPAPQTEKEPAGSGSASAGSGAASGSAAGSDTAMAGAGSASGSAAGSATPDASAEFVHILATHVEPKPDDPVVVSVTKFKVVKADFDPKVVEGGSADLELDLTSLETGSAKRDNHLKSPDYLDTTQFATVGIHIDNVKKAGDAQYSADATVKARGAEKKIPVTFTVLETMADGIKIKGEAKFTRQDFSIGKDVPDQPVASDLTIQLQLVLKKSA